MDRSSRRALLLLVASSAALPGGTMEPARAAVSAGAITLARDTAVVPLDAAQGAALFARLEAYFEECSPYRDVVGEEGASPEELAKLWRQQLVTVHATLRVADEPDAPVRNRETPRELQFDFPVENEGLGHVLARDADARITRYIKCPGLEALLLACHVHGLVPGIEPSPRCPELEALAARAADPSAEAGKP